MTRRSTTDAPRPDPRPEPTKPDPGFGTKPPSILGLIGFYLLVFSAIAGMILLAVR